MAETKRFKIEEDGFKFGQHYKKGDIINLFPGQEINYVPPLGTGLTPLDENDKPIKTAKKESQGNGEPNTGNDNADNGIDKMSKADLIAKLTEINEKQPDEEKLNFNESMTKPELIALLKSFDNKDA